MYQLSIEDILNKKLSNKIETLNKMYEEFLETRDLVLALNIEFLQNDIRQEYGWGLYKLTKRLKII